MNPGYASGFWRVTKSGSQTFTDNANRGLMEAYNREQLAAFRLGCSIAN